MHWTDRAPVLSATVNLVCICIIKFLQLNSRRILLRDQSWNPSGSKGASKNAGAGIAAKSAIMHGGTLPVKHFYNQRRSARRAFDHLRNTPALVFDIGMHSSIWTRSPVFASSLST